MPCHFRFCLMWKFCTSESAAKLASSLAIGCRSSRRCSWFKKVALALKFTPFHSGCYAGRHWSSKARSVRLKCFQSSLAPNVDSWLFALGYHPGRVVPVLVQKSLFSVAHPQSQSFFLYHSVGKKYEQSPVLSLCWRSSGSGSGLLSVISWSFSSNEIFQLGSSFCRASSSLSHQPRGLESINPRSKERKKCAWIMNDYLRQHSILHFK